MIDDIEINVKFELMFVRHYSVTFVTDFWTSFS